MRLTMFGGVRLSSAPMKRATQALMGHATPEMTLKMYAKKEESRLLDAVEKLGSFLAG